MTNSEKYLKDGVDRYQFAKEIQDCFGEEIPLVDETILDWLADDSKPILTEDEKVILRNLRDKYKYIGREGMLYIAEQERNSNFVSQVVIDEYKSDLFQFIKERRRIFY